MAADMQMAKEFDKLLIPEKPEKSRDEIKRIWKEKTDLEIDMQKRMLEIRVPNPQQAAMIKQLETCKAHDKIYLKHGIRTNQLIAAVEFYGLRNDKEVKAFEAKAKQSAESHAADQEKKKQLTPAAQAQLDSVVAELGKIDTSLGSIQPEDFGRVMFAI